MNSESTNNKQANDNKVDSPLSWIIASLGQVAHFTSVVIRNDNKVDSPLTTHNSLVKAIAFTLAETLVVMGIIGVVAALTIPNLNQSTGDREKVAKVKKIYSNLEDAFGRATAVYGPFDEWFTNFGEVENYEDFQAINNRFSGRILEFMKVSKDCGYEGTGCFVTSSRPKELSGATYQFVPIDKRPKVLLADGTALLFSKEDSSLIYVDIDGVKGSNTVGKDIFSFIVATRGGIRPIGHSHNNESLKTNCFTIGEFCTGWVIKTGNMDYLKANKGVCPNGTELSWENTSCK